MSPSPNFRSAAFAPVTSEAFVCLLTIDHAELSVPVRLCNNNVLVPLDRNGGEDYLPLPFLITLPNDSEDSPPVARLIMDNISRELVVVIRSLATPPAVTIELVSSRDWNVVEATFTGFEMQQITYDAMTIQADLVFENLDREPWPSGTYTPSKFRGVF